MKALLIGGTGTISMAIVRQLALDPQWDVWVLNRGNRNECLPEGVHSIIADIHKEAETAEKLEGMTFDAVCEFVGFRREDVERDYRLFAGRTRQYIYISSASAYHKPAANYIITEGTTLSNPYWQYSRDKIDCEAYLMKQYRENGFPVTIVRPSHTYDERNIPVGVHGNNGSWQVIRRMMEEKTVLIPGDGSSLWTLTFNTDFAKGYIGLMGNRRAVGEAFHITSDEALTWNQVHQTIADALGVQLHPLHVSSDFLAFAGKSFGYDYEGALVGDKSVSVVFDNSKIKRIVPEMHATVRFDQGIRIALDNIMKHPELQRADPDFDRFTDRVVDAVETARKTFL